MRFEKVRGLRTESLLGPNQIRAKAVRLMAPLFPQSYIKTYETEDDMCMQKYLCEANNDCVYSTGDTGYLFCQIGT